MLRIAAITVAGAAARTVVPFQYAWRFHYGDDDTVKAGDWPAGPGTCAFEEDLQDFAICEGMEHAPNRFCEKDCRTACCYDPDCLVWQAYPIEKGRECYHGYRGANITCAAGEKKSGLGGGRRSESPSPAFRTDYDFAQDVSHIDDAWEVVDAPHDFIAERGNFTADSTNFKQGYLPRNVSWYRKHFQLPAEWKEGVTFVHFEGVFHRAEIYLNGEFLQVHDCGYTGFTVRLDNATKVRFGDGRANVLAVRADASYGSGHWYEGGGLYRPVQLVHTANTHFVQDGIFVPPEVTPAGFVMTWAELEGAMDAATVEIHLLTADGSELARNSSQVSVAAIGTTTIELTLQPGRTLELWSVQKPTLHRVHSVIKDSEGRVLDSLTQRVGFRSVNWAVDPSFVLNGEDFKLRGFSHHTSMGGLGVAIPERVNLFRVQAGRALGANVWRTSHNPYPPALYDLLDATGQLCWDENRDYGVKYGGGIYAEAMRDMVKRGRNHPSIVIWSICNEFECAQFDSEASVLAFKEATKSMDHTRPVSANLIPGNPDLGDIFKHLDVVGLSHKDNSSFADFHSEQPETPMVLSECCSCSSQRPQRDELTCMAEQNSPSLLPYVAGSLGVWTLMDYFGEAAGTGTSSWPAVSSNFGQFDIAGFPKSNALWYSVNWLEAAQDTGRPALVRRTVARILDLPDRLSSLKPVISAVTSAPRAELVVDGKSMGVKRTPRDQFGQQAKITWELPVKASAVSQCTGPESFPHNASMVQCMGLDFVAAASDPESCAKACCASHLCNTWQFDTSDLAKGCWIGSAAVASCQDPPPGNKGVKMIGGQSSLPCDPHFDTAILRALDEEGQVLATHTLRSPTCSGKRRLRLTMDVPSESTGTGRTLVLDGRDTGLLRVSVVEPRPSKSSVPGLFLAADGEDEVALVSSATDRITWRVVSGPGRIVGVSSGNEASHEWLKSHSVAAYGGLARGFVQVTMDCVSEHRDLAASIDQDNGRSKVTLANSCQDDSIVVEASAKGFESVRMVVPVVADMNESPLAVAERSAQGLKFTYLDEFLG